VQGLDARGFNALAHAIKGGHYQAALMLKEEGLR
jgi:hypothetical protein